MYCLNIIAIDSNKYICSNRDLSSTFEGKQRAFKIDKNGMDVPQNLYFISKYVWKYVVQE